MKTIHILLVEDNEGDIQLTTDALEEAKIHVELSVVRDGREAMDFVSQKGKYADVDLPDLLLLDVNLPKRNGLEVLDYMKGSEYLKQIPVIMLSTSSSKKDIDYCYEHFANCFITKPVEVSDFLAVVASIENFWISIVKLPTNKS